MKFFIKDFFVKCGQICTKLRVWSYLQEKSLMENFIFCAVTKAHFHTRGSDNFGKIEKVIPHD